MRLKGLKNIAVNVIMCLNDGRIIPDSLHPCICMEIGGYTPAGGVRHEKEERQNAGHIGIEKQK